MSFLCLLVRHYYYIAALFLLLLLGVVEKSAATGTIQKTEKITLKAGFLPSESFGNFQIDLLERLKRFALENDNITLSFVFTEIQELYTSNLPLISSECSHDEGETTVIIINDVEYNCNDFDFLVGDFWMNPDRYEIVNFTPPWLQTSISAIKYTNKIKFPELDITTLNEASRTGVGVCVLEDSYGHWAVGNYYPNINLVPCTADDTSTGCLNQLEDERCFLLVSDELALRQLQADEPYLEMTGEKLEQQWLAWPVRRSLDPTVSFLLNKWMYAALSNQTIAELYFEYFAKKLCPIGTAGKNCELYCDPRHGSADKAGKCICESPRWIGDDCSIEVPEDVNSIPSTLIIIAYAMLAISILVILFCGAWLYWQRNTVQVRVSQPFFLLLVLLGCLMSTLTIAAMAAQDDSDGDDPSWACMAMPWLYSVGFSITFGTLFAKIRRVYIIFSAPPPSSSRSGRLGDTIRRQPVTFGETLLCIGVVLALDLIILISWSIIDPLVWQRIVVEVDRFGDPLESEGHCICDSWVTFASILAALHFGLLAVACYMCYVARDIPSKFSEHKYVTIAMISNLQIFVVGVPILIIVWGDPGASFFVRTVIIWMNDLAVVTIIFGNLMCSVHMRAKNDYTANSSLERLERIDVELEDTTNNHSKPSGDHVRNNSQTLEDTTNKHSKPSGDHVRNNTQTLEDTTNKHSKPSGDHVRDNTQTFPDQRTLPSTPSTRPEAPIFSPSLSATGADSVQKRSSKTGADYVQKRSLVKSVSFKEDVSVSEITFLSESKADSNSVGETFAKIKDPPTKLPRKPFDRFKDGPAIPLPALSPSHDSSPCAPRRCPPGESIVEDLDDGGLGPLSKSDGSHTRKVYDPSPKVPKRPPSDASIVEELDEGDMEPLSKPNDSHASKVSDDASPKVPKRLPPGASIVEDLDEDGLGPLSKPDGSQTRRLPDDASPKVPKRLPLGASIVEEADNGDMGPLSKPSGGHTWGLPDDASPIALTRLPLGAFVVEDVNEGTNPTHQIEKLDRPP